MNVVKQVTLTPELAAQAKAYLQERLREHAGVEAVALCALNATVIWASSRAFEKIAPSIGRIGIASLRMWARTRTGRVERIGLMANNGGVDIIFVPPLASLLVVSSTPSHQGWPDGEPEGLIRALGL